MTEQHEPSQKLEAISGTSEGEVDPAPQVSVVVLLKLELCLYSPGSHLVGHIRV